MADEMKAVPGVPDWGVGRYEHFAQALRPAAQVLVDAAGVAPGDRVLDVGCGTGNAALLAAAAGAAVTAVDPSPRLLSVAAEAARVAGVALECRVGEAAALPVPDDAYSVVLSSFGIMFALDPVAAAAEVARVLSPHGRVLITAWLPGGGMDALGAELGRRVQEVTGAPASNPGLPWYDVTAVQELFEPHGLAVTGADEHVLAFTGPSPALVLRDELAHHPRRIAALEVLDRAGRGDEARERLLELLHRHNEDPTGFRVTSRYVVLRITAPRS